MGWLLGFLNWLKFLHRRDCRELPEQSFHASSNFVERAVVYQGKELLTGRPSIYQLPPIFRAIMAASRGIIATPTSSSRMNQCSRLTWGRVSVGGC